MSEFLERFGISKKFTNPYINLNGCLKFEEKFEELRIEKGLDQHANIKEEVILETQEKIENQKYKKGLNLSRQKKAHKKKPSDLKILYDSKRSDSQESE